MIRLFRGKNWDVVIEFFAKGRDMMDTLAGKLADVGAKILFRIRW